MEVHISPRLMTNSSIKPCHSAITHKIPNLSSSADSQCYNNFYAMWSPQMLELSRIMTTLRTGICRDSCFHSGLQGSICGQQQGSVDVASDLSVHLVLFSMCIGFSQSPILASLQSVVHRSWITFGIRHSLILVHHSSRCCIALIFISPANTQSPTLSNFRSSLKQKEPTPSQVRNHYSQKNQETHLESAIASKKAANHHCPSNVCLPIICLGASYCG